jgi:hypothetical protein
MTQYKVIEHARDHEIRIALSRCQALVDRQTILADQMRDDRLAVPDRLAVIDDVGKLSARRRRRVEDVLMRECNAGEPEKGVDLEAVAIVVGDAEQCRI